MDWLNSIKNFQLIVEKNSFSKAARNNYSSSSSLSKQLNWLEDQLRIQLIYRSTRHLSLTEEGKQFYNQSKIIVNQLDNLIKETQESNYRVTGSLTIAAPRTFGQTVLVKYMPVFMKDYPDIKVKIKLSNEYQDLINEQIDVAIRTQPILDKMLISEELSYKRKGLFVSPDLIKDTSIITSLKDLHNYPCLAHTDFKTFDVWMFKKDNLRITPYLATNELNILLDAAVNGRGVVYLSEYVVEPYLKDNRLIPLLESYWPDPVLHSVVYPRSTFISSKIKAFIDFIKSINF
jgi:DNA-binding transcriptional LysR family regulator